MQRFRDCPECLQRVRLRETGSTEVYGTFWKHRNPALDGPDNWCGHGGQLPPRIEYTNPLTLPAKPRRVECPECHTEVRVRKNNTLYVHYDPQVEDPSAGHCLGSGSEAAQPNDNVGWAISGGMFWPKTDDSGTPDKTSVEVLADWWAKKARHEAAMVCAKAVEYGATDLRDLGYQILEMAGRRNQLPEMDDEDGNGYDADGYATEVGIAFYAMGKLARIAAAVKEGRRPSYDSWLDLGVYARMAQRVHEHGGWPAV